MLVAASAFGDLALVTALAALAAAARLLGDRHEPGFFGGRLRRTIWRYPEITRRRSKWHRWSGPLSLATGSGHTTGWDEAALLAIGAIGLWHYLPAESDTRP